MSRIRSALRPVRRVGGFFGWLTVLLFAGMLLVPALLGFDRYVIVSGSMVPVVDRGSIVFSKPVDVNELKVGDVITYMPPPQTGVGHLVTHRISSIENAPDGTGRVFRTKGDANKGNDPWTFQLVKGDQNVMRYSLPLVGYVLIALADPQIRILAIGVPAVIVGLVALWDIVREFLPGRRRVAATS